MVVSTARRLGSLRDGYPGQVDVLHDSPHDGQATGFRREGVNLIGAQSNIAKETLDGVGTPNVAVHNGWKRVKRQEMFFILAETADSFGIALLIFGFEGDQIEQRIFFLLLFENSGKFRTDLFAFTMRNRVQNIALFMHDTARPRSRGKESRDSSKKPFMSISHDQIELGRTTSAQILRASNSIRLCLPPHKHVRPARPCSPPNRPQGQLR